MKNLKDKTLGHTKGPWMVSSDGYRVFSQAANGLVDKQIVITAWNPATRTPENKSNARLISVAPELLQLVVSLRRGMECICHLRLSDNEPACRSCYVDGLLREAGVTNEGN